ncbi:PREDICTED: long-chain-fatty-acid--CoA ligase ACSBG2-like [Amphimedon queenslandica]|uniref:long-chain-fatty-acid--CoA ligase n=2 Tax=Amphimedon queenslandica TaxID=400682 RepID=A0A1X7TUX5_AMPQE|nr:PREDICTED: long-chain-fatty-acid--CoA ligase ACSBG2-like [Amphimedon queenslandica]|eukprot:XP_019857705.1 PREDICTED: long-chain-fatty-acid--CoA ligase ACSBG2-like [Amphimedon queenslandica]
MAVASQLSLDLHSSNGGRKEPDLNSPSFPSPVNPNGESSSAVSTPPQLRTLSVSSSGSSGPSLTSEEFKLLHSREGLSLDLGSEAGNVADIFGSLSLDTDGLIFDETNVRQKNQSDVPAVSSTFWSCDPSVGVTIQLGTEGAAAEKPITIIDMFHRTVTENGGSVALAYKRAGQWKEINYTQYYEMSLTIAKAFIKLGLEPYHGVCILGSNSPEWHIANMATIMSGGLPVGLYLTNTPEACCFIADSCKANIIVLENDAHLQKILQIRPRLTHLKAIVYYGKICSPKEEGMYEWKDLKKMAAGEERIGVERRFGLLAPEKCASLIYTSGTTGCAKGVMLSHDNITWMCSRILKETKAKRGEERVISYLPLSHVATQLLDIYFPLAIGASVWFAQPDALKGSLLQTLREVHPTIFLGVPRVWEKISESMQLVARNTTGLKAKISQWAKGVGLKGNLQKQLGGSGTPFGWSLANLIFFKKVRRGLGLDQCHFPMTGSAPISQDTLSYFMSVNIPLHELYGMSETTGPTTVTTQDDIRFQSSGRSLDGVRLRINNPDDAGNGEVLIQGRHLFMGYIGEPKATSDTLTEDGWLKSGDIGYINHEGFLYITGRAKELLVLATGENIAPVPIESALKEQLPIVSNAVIVGDQKSYISCLITLKVEFDDVTGYATDRLNPTALAICQSCGSQSKTVRDILDEPSDHRVLKMIQNGIDRVNRGAACKKHKIVKWSILDRDFSIQSGELTHTMKLKRRFITIKYSDIIESFY